MATWFKQYGGGWGSKAGDCCVIKSGNSYCIIDLGIKDQCKQAIEEVFGGTLTSDNIIKNVKNKDIENLTLLITHFHDDHIYDGNLWKALSNVCKNKKIDLSVGCPKPLNEKNSKYKDMLTVFGDRVKLITNTAWSKPFWFHQDQSNGVTCDCYPIVSAPSSGSTDENETSLGVFVDINKGNEIYSFLSLGDMVPSIATKEIQFILNKKLKGDDKLDFLKLAHHGSESNLFDCVDDYIEAETVVLISGYTRTATKNLCDKLKIWKLEHNNPKILLQNTDEAITELGPENKKKLEELGVEFATSFKRDF